MASGTLIKPKTTFDATDVTLPFTPTSNGLLLCEIRATSTAGRFSAIYSGTFPPIIEGMAQASVQNYAIGALWVTKGTQVKTTSTANLLSQKYKFVSID